LCALGGFWGKHNIPFYTALLPPPLSSEFKNLKIFHSFSFLRAGELLKKMKENFADFESQLQTGAEAGAYKSSKIFLEKGSSAVVNVLQFAKLTFFWYNDSHARFNL